MKTKIKKVAKSDNTFKLEMILTKGELMALKHALEAYPFPVGQDVYSYLTYAIQQENIDL